MPNESYSYDIKVKCPIPVSIMATTGFIYVEWSDGDETIRIEPSKELAEVEKEEEERNGEGAPHRDQLQGHRGR